MTQITKEITKEITDQWLSDLGSDPYKIFENWYGQAAAAGISKPDAMTLATATPDGLVSARIVLLKGVVAGGFQFFTNYESRKALEIEQNPRAALVFHWDPLEREVRVEGRVKKLDRTESIKYFATRPRISQLGAWASKQSQRLASRDDLQSRFREVEELFEGKDVPCPDYWGGYTVVPDSIEFWQGQVGRLHDRCVFKLKNSGGIKSSGSGDSSASAPAWEKSRLSP